MTDKRIYLSPPHLSGLEEDFVQKTLKSNWIAPVGPNLGILEREISELVDTADTCLTTSATAAIHLSLILSEVKQRDIVFIQSHTHIGSVNPILYQGAIPIFIDSEPDSWNMSATHLEDAIQAIKENKKEFTGELKAIIPVHLYGMPAAMNEILDVAKKYDIPVIEDAAESLGSTYKGKHTGTFGKMGVYSFNGNKIITTSGGGALISNDESLVEKSRFLATQARDPALHFQHSETGYNYRLSNVLAGIGRAQIQVLSQRIEQRRANFKRYRDYFERWNTLGFNIRFQEEDEDSLSNRWLSCILIDPMENFGLNKDLIQQALEKENIESRPLWKPVHLQPLCKEYPFFGDGTSEYLFNNGLCLPSGSNLTNEDFQRILSIITQVFERYVNKD